MQIVEASEPIAVEVVPSARRESTGSGASSDSEVSAGSPSSSTTMASPALLKSPSDATSSDGRDSGVEADVFAPPDAALAEQIVEAVEFYFSDESLLKDAFLLKHVRRNKEGYVSIKLISSFKRVKHICRDWRVVAHALLQSTALEINEGGTKARRLQPLPEHDETITSRTVVAVSLPMESPTIANVSAMFGVCGDISSIRILKPGQNVPVEVRAAFNKHPDIAWENVNCAVVEFDLQEQAKRAMDTMATDVMPIIPIGKVSNKKKSRQEEMSGREEDLQSVSAAVTVPADVQKKRRQRRKKNPLAHSDSRSSLSGTDGEWSAPSSRRHTPPQGSPLLMHPPPLLSRPPPLLSGPPPLLSTPPPLLSQPPPLLPLPAGLVARRTSPPSGGRSSFASTDIRLLAADVSQPPPQQSHKKQSAAAFVPVAAPAGPCPWVQRKKASGMLEGDRRGSLVTQQNVLRAPRGPDGSSGFSRALRTSRPTATPVASPAPNPIPT